jgi:hypothetical protein
MGLDINQTSGANFQNSISENQEKTSDSKLSSIKEANNPGADNQIGEQSSDGVSENIQKLNKRTTLPNLPKPPVLPDEAERGHALAGKFEQQVLAANETLTELLQNKEVGPNAMGAYKALKEMPPQILEAALHRRNEEGRTSLHLAAENGKGGEFLEMVATKLKLNEEQLEELLTAEDSNGKTPLHLAKEAGDPGDFTGKLAEKFPALMDQLRNSLKLGEESDDI